MKSNFLIVFIICFSTQISAQENTETLPAADTALYVPKFSFGLDLQLGFPLEDFREKLGQVAFGFGANFLMRTNPKARIPVMMGLTGNLVSYDSQSQDQILFIDGFSTDVRLTTRNSIFMGHGVFRILPPVNYKIQPYFEGLIGFKNLFTRTTLQEIAGFSENETIESYIEQGDWAFSFGGAVGLQVLAGDFEGVYILVDGRCAYLKGNAADYLVRIEDSNVPVVDPIDVFEEKNSITDMLLPQIGVSFVF